MRQVPLDILPACWGWFSSLGWEKQPKNKSGLAVSNHAALHAVRQHQILHPWKITSGEHPIAGKWAVNHAFVMKQNKSFLNKKQNSPRPGPSLAALWLLQNETTFSPSADDVARKVGLSFVNQALQPLREVRRWLEAEAKLITEHNLVRVRSFNHRNY
jgi:hypothetical protein